MADIRNASFFSALRSAIVKLADDLRADETTALGDELDLTVSDVPGKITFLGGTDPSYPTDVHVVFADVDVTLPMGWLS